MSGRRSGWQKVFSVVALVGLIWSPYSGAPQLLDGARTAVPLLIQETPHTLASLWDAALALLSTLD